MTESGWLTGAVALILISAALVALTVALSRRAAARVPPLGRFVDLPAARLHMVDRGDPGDSGALPLILIHGLGGQLRHFSYRLIDELVRTHRVIAYDRPGSGYSTWKPGRAGTLSEQVDLVGALATSLGLGKFILVGHSLGGAIAIGAAIAHRERVAGLALLAPLTRLPGAAPVRGADWLRRVDWVWRVIAWSWAVPVASLRRPQWLRSIFMPDPVPGDFAIRGGGDLVLRPEPVLGAARDALDIPRWLTTLTSHYPTLHDCGTLPIGVLYGRQDRVLSASEQGERFASDIAHVALRQIDGGHMLPVTQPEACAQLIRWVADAARR